MHVYVCTWVRTTSVQVRFLQSHVCARVIDDSIVNFWAKYDGEAEEVPHVLQTEQYKTENDADYDSTWMLLEPLEQLEPPEQLVEPRAEQAASRLRSGL